MPEYLRNPFESVSKSIEKEFPSRITTDWTVGEKITKSGQSNTYHVTEKATGREGVLKIQNSRKGGASRLRQEAHILASIGHPGVVRLWVTNADEQQEPVFIITERIIGPTLTSLINSKLANISDALTTSERLYEILEHIHSLTPRIIHRDIKPDNILVRDNAFNDPVLIDFGIAHANPNSKQTGLYERVGNYFLELPEATEGTLDKRDPRSDSTYVAGILLFMLTGKYPKKILETWYGSMPHQRIRAKEAISSLKPPEQEALTRFFDKAFQFSRRNRFQSAKAARQILADIRTGSLRQCPISALQETSLGFALNYRNFKLEAEFRNRFRARVHELLLELGNLERPKSNELRSIFERSVHENDDLGRLLEIFDLFDSCPNELDEVWEPFIRIVGSVFILHLSSSINTLEDNLADELAEQMQD